MPPPRSLARFSLVPARSINLAGYTPQTGRSLTGPYARGTAGYHPLSGGGTDGRPDDGATARGCGTGPVGAARRTRTARPGGAGVRGRPVRGQRDQARGGHPRGAVAAEVADPGTGLAVRDRRRTDRRGARHRRGRDAPAAPPRAPGPRGARARSTRGHGPPA